MEQSIANAISKNFDEARKKIKYIQQIMTSNPFEAYEVLREVYRDLDQAGVTLMNILKEEDNGGNRQNLRLAGKLGRASRVVREKLS